MGLIQKVHLAVDAHGMSVRIVITDPNTADCTQASKLINGIKAEYLLADKGYDTDEMIVQAESQGMIALIPPRENRKVQRKYDKDLYKLRHLVDNALLHFKRWRGIASRYAKLNPLAAVQIRCIALWANIS